MNDAAKISMTGNADFSVGVIPVNSMRIGQSRLRSADDSHRRLNALCLAAIKNDRVEDFRGDSEFIGGLAKGQPPSLMRHRRDPFRRGIALRAVGHHHDGVFNVIFGSEDFSSLRIDHHGRNHTDISRWANNLTHWTGLSVLRGVAGAVVQQQALAVGIAGTSTIILWSRSDTVPRGA